MRFVVLFVTLLLLILTNGNRISSENWDYNRFGPDVWYKNYPYCQGESQSPVNVKTACTTLQTFSPFEFSSNFHNSLSLTLVNDGHTIKGHTNGEILTISGGNFDGIYTFVNFHLHWGPNENVGSEHQINGMKYTGESHFVFENLQTNHTMVLAFFMKDENVSLDHEKTPQISEWIKYFNSTFKLEHENDSTIVELNFSLLMLEELTDFWRYEGSLTIPPCTPNVTWTIFRDPISIYNYEFEIFREDFFFEGYRGPQNLYLRQIYRSFSNETISPIPDQRCCSNQQPSTSTFTTLPSSSSSSSPLCSFYKLVFIFSLVFSRLI